MPPAIRSRPCARASEARASEARAALAVVLAVAVAVAVSACVDLKAPSATEPPLVPDEAGVVDAGDGDATVDALDAGADADGETAAGDPYAALRDTLAAQRVRVADPPLEWVASGSHVFTIDAQRKAHAFVPPSGAVVDFAFSLLAYSHISGNDDYVVELGDDVNVYAAGEPNHLLRSVTKDATWANVNTASKAIAILATNGVNRNLLIWNPLTSGTPASSGTVAEGAGLRFLRASGDRLYYASTSATKLWTVDTQAKTAGATPLGRDPTAVDVTSAAGLVTEAFVGSFVTYELIVAGKAPRDLSAEITAASSIIPAAARKPVGSFSQFGSWLVYAASGGIFAFDIATKRLAACQIRGAADGFFRDPRILDATGLLVFSRLAGPTQGSTSQGLFAVKLASVLPP